MWKKIVNNNSQLQNEAIQYFTQGDSMWNFGKTIQEMDQALKYIDEGLKIMILWIQKEDDYQFQQKLKSIYENKGKELQQKQRFLQNLKNQASAQTQYLQPLQQNQVHQVSVNHQQAEQQNQKMLEQQRLVEQQRIVEYQRIEKQIENQIMKIKSNVQWADIAGQAKIKAALEESVLLPMKFPSLFKELLQPLKNNILIFGPTGSGKTYLVTACASEAEAKFFFIPPSILISSKVEESELRIKLLFQLAKKYQPSIIFMDDIDLVLGTKTCVSDQNSQRLIGQMISEISSLEKQKEIHVIILAATNNPRSLQPAIITKFEKKLFVELPEFQDRQSLIKQILSSQGCGLNDDQIDNLCSLTGGYSTSDINSLIKEAHLSPIRKLQQAKKFKQVNVNGHFKWTPVQDNEEGTNMNWQQLNTKNILLPEVTYQDYLDASARIKKSVSEGEIFKFRQWSKEFVSKN